MKEFFQVFLNSLWILVFLVLIWVIHILQLTFQIAINFSKKQKSCKKLNRTNSSQFNYKKKKEK